MAMSMSMTMTMSLRPTMTMQPFDHPVEDGVEPRLGRSVSIDQAAILLGVCRRTIYNRIRSGSLQTVRTLGTSQRVLVASIDEHRRAVWGGPERHIQPPRPANVLAFAPRRTTL
jgi:excisionase family DNA binding protein